ncbi:MAG: sulfurtransferase TusA family protein [Gammaproteobacteria bacterium]|nr:sulfurtransferase TusA family protein [Gammaproteobacteria bacterium]
MSDIELDARRLLCPMPVIRTQDRIKELSAGDILRVICSDRGALHDIPTWCRLNGHRVVDVVDGQFEIIIRVEVGQAD